MSPAVPEPDARALAMLGAEMRRVQRQALHGAGCACCGRGVVRIDPRAIEADLLGYLAARYRDAGDPALIETIEAWLAEPMPGLIARLGGAGAPSPAPDKRRRMLRELLDVLALNRDEPRMMEHAR